MIRYFNNKVYLSSKIPHEALEWRNDKNIYKWCRQFTLLSEVDHENWLKKIEIDPTIKMFGIYIDLGIKLYTPIGVCGLTSINLINRNAEFSLYIASKYQGAGLGYEALETLLAHGFYDYNLKRIWGEMYDNNPAEKMFLNIGLKKEGTLRNSYFRDGKYIDSHIFSILDNEFFERYKK